MKSAFNSSQTGVFRQEWQSVLRNLVVGNYEPIETRNFKFGNESGEHYCVSIALFQLQLKSTLICICQDDT